MIVGKVIVKWKVMVILPLGGAYREDCSLEGGKWRMLALWILSSEMGVECVHVVGGQEREVSYICSRA
jgi:hypothetical protein